MQKNLRTICWMFFFALLLGCCMNAPRASARSISPRTSNQQLTEVANFGQFTGTWTAHSSFLIFTRSGEATFEARTYQWCNAGASQPCDTIDARGYILPGDRETLQFSRIDGSVAYGAVTRSNLHPQGLAVSVTLLPNDTLLYASTVSISLLCGPRAPVGTCGA
jgi:hypothetical protein